MADVNKINPQDFLPQSYNSQDISLISNNTLQEEFSDSSYIEFYVYDLNQNLLTSNLNYTNYQILDSEGDIEDNTLSTIITDPQNDLEKAGFSDGSYVAYYNFFDKQIGDPVTNLYISAISTDRTELRLDSTVLSNLDIIEQTNNFISQRNIQNYFVDFYINFSGNNFFIANNILLENTNPDTPTILVKLYEPLPLEFDLKSELWIVTSINPPQAFEVNFPEEPIEINDFTQIAGPNLNVSVKDKVNNSSQNLSYNNIISSAPTSSQNQINSLLKESSININVDYTNFNNFIHFSSAQTRIENFYYKVGLIETYTSESLTLTNITSSNTSKNIIQKKISNLIENFDRFEYFMYYSSGSSISYPKSNSTLPYTLSSVTSPQVLTWLGSIDETNSNYGGQLLSASNYDNNNPNYLFYSIPEYLREDFSNQPYELFVDMVAQYYDNVWLYTKDITQKYNADNRLDFGVSKDLVADAIRDFGLKLYQNNFSNKELYTAFLGMTPEGSLFPFPEITGSMPVPTGMEFVNTMISASNDVISMDDTNKSLYKRIYHNIPYLLKSKGTLAGLRALITSYGIPDTILKISEFGGKDQVNANDYDLYFNNFNYALGVGPNTNFVSSSWAINSAWVGEDGRPSTVQLRFKSEEFLPTSLSQSLWQVHGSGLTGELLLDYSGSGLISESYAGSIPSSSYQYANLRFIPQNDAPNISASISLPFYNNDWWSVMVTTDQNNTFNLYAGNKIYNGNDGTSIGYYASSSVAGAQVEAWNTGTTSIFASASLNYSQYKSFSGSLQEIRYYTQQISESVFKDYVMNPLSFEGNGINSAPDQLIFRADLGSELDTNTISSIHPKVTGSWATTSSFTSNSNFIIPNARPYPLGTYETNIETFFLDQPAVGIKNRITDKIRSESDTLPSGSVLSPIRRLSQTTEASASYTDNINYLEVAFSPQNQINDDIISQMGHFNIGDYIGDPRQRSSSAQIYPDLNDLSEEYFKKYIKQYDLVDFVRLIKFFDNSLFKMIKDFIPARTSLASGLVVKQHLLERNKYKQPTVQSPINELLTGSIQSKQIWNTASQATEMSSSLIESFNGGAAGMFNPFNNEYEFFISSSITTLTVNTNVSASLLEPSLLSYNSGDAPAGGGLYINITNGTSYSQNAHNISHFNTYISEGNALYAVAFLTDNLDSNLNPLQGSSALNFFLDGDSRPTPIAKLSSILTTSTNTGAKVFQTVRPSVTSDATDVSTLGIDNLGSSVVFFFVIDNTPASGNIENGYLGSDILANNFINSSSIAPNQTIFHDVYTYSTSPQFNITQSYSITTPSLSGSVTRIHRSEDEFYNGELSGSTLVVSNGELNEDCEQFKFVNPQGGKYGIRTYSSASGDSFGVFINSNQKPLNGFIQTYFIEDNQTGIPTANPVAPPVSG